MAPKTIAIHRHKVDPVSPIPVRRDDFPKSQQHQQLPPSRHQRSRSQPLTLSKPMLITSAGRSASAQGRELDDLRIRYEETKQRMEKMKRDKSENNKRLIEMSGLVKSLQDIPVGIDKAEGSTFVNVQRKIEAIGFEMKEAKKRYDELRNEESFQTDTIKEQESQIRSMEKQIQLLTERIQQEEQDQQEQKKMAEEKQKASTAELEQKIMLQDMEIMNLMGEIDMIKKHNRTHDQNRQNTIGQDIKLLEANNAAKYEEIKKMEDKLAKMREEQRAQKMEQETVLKKQSEESNGFVLKPTATTFAEISKLEDNLATLRLVQEKSSNVVDAPKKEEATEKKPASSRIQKHQPWSMDLAWKDSMLEGNKKKEAELEVVANNDITYGEPVSPESDQRDQELLGLPSFGQKQQVEVKSATKKTENSAFVGISSLSVASCGSSSEESESESEGSVIFLNKQRHKNPFDVSKDNNPHDVKKDNDHSDTSATVGSSCGMSRDGDSASVESSSLNKPTMPKRSVELMPTDDGSIEAIEVGHLRKTESIESCDGAYSDNESSVEYSSGESTTGNDTNGDSSNDSSVGEYTSGESTRTETRSVLAQIPEEGELEESESEWDREHTSGLSKGPSTPKTNDEPKSKDDNVSDLLLTKQLKDAEDKYENLKKDYEEKISMSESQAKKLDEYSDKISTTESIVKKLEEENQKLRKEQSNASKKTWKDSADKKRLKRIKEENKMLLKNMEKQNDIMMKADQNFDDLRKEHLATLEELEAKKKRYDQLVLDFTKLADRNKDAKDYSRLQTLHNAVVMKLADMGEENENLEKQRDEAMDRIERKNAQIRGFDGIIAEYNKVEYDLKVLRETHEETVKELHDLTEKNKEMQSSYDNDFANAQQLESLEQDKANAIAEIEKLMKANMDLSAMEVQQNESEVRVTMLEEELKKTQEELGVAKNKSSNRQRQLKDVIAQYKALKEEHSGTCDKLARLETTVNGLGNGSAIQEMKKLEDAVEQAKKEAQNAVNAKEAREGDMRIVLQHYEKLQIKFEKLKAKSESTKSESTKSESAVEEEEKKDEQDVFWPGEEKDARKEKIEELEELLKESNESLSWRDEEIAKKIEELKEARKQIEDLEIEKEQLQADVLNMQSQLAQREAKDAEDRKKDEKDNLRTVVAEHHRLQKTYSSLQRKFEEVKSELVKVKNQAKIHEQEEKHAQKRVTNIQTEYVNLQADYDVVVAQLERFKVEMATSVIDMKEKGTIIPDMTSKETEKNNPVIASPDISPKGSDVAIPLTASEENETTISDTAGKENKEVISLIDYKENEKAVPELTLEEKEKGIIDAASEVNDMTIVHEDSFDYESVSDDSNGIAEF